MSPNIAFLVMDPAGMYEVLSMGSGNLISPLVVSSGSAGEKTDRNTSW